VADAALRDELLLAGDQIAGRAAISS